MSLAYFDDTATVYISCTDGWAVRIVDRVKVDCTYGETKDSAVIYIPIYSLRNMKFIDPGSWDPDNPETGKFTLRPGDRFTFRNSGRGGGTVISTSNVFTVREVEINTRGSHRMRHIKAKGDNEK